MLNNEYFIWGAGTYGRRLIQFMGDDIKFKGVIDNNPTKQGTVFHGVPVISYEQAKDFLPETKIVVSLSTPTQVSSFLQEQNLTKNSDYYTIWDFVSRYYWEKDKLIAKTINLLPTTMCNMKCTNCQAYIPYAVNHINASSADLIEDTNLMFMHIDKVININFCAGENLLNNQLSKVTHHINEHYADRYFEMCIQTNGTIIPKDDDMRRFSDSKVIFSVSEYPENPKITEKFIGLCDKFNVGWYSNRQADRELWHDFGNPHEITETNPQQLKARYQECFIPGVAVYEGWLYLCAAQSWSHAIAAAGTREQGDAFDLRQPKTPKTRKEVYRIISRQPEQGYISHCMRCNGTVPVMAIAGNQRGQNGQ